MDRLRNDYRNLQPNKWSKTGWIEMHYHQKELLRKSYASVVEIFYFFIYSLFYVDTNFLFTNLQIVLWL